VQRLKQTASQAAHPLAISGRQVFSSYDQLASIIADRLSRRHASLLASPHIEPTGEVTWSTALEGPVAHEDELPAAARTDLQARAQSLLADIRGLAATLHAEGRAATQMVADMLDYATRTPPGNWLYSVGGEPVLVMWGHSDGPLPPPFAKALEAVTVLPAASAAAAASVAAVPAAAAAGVAEATAVDPSTEHRKKRWLPLLLLALLGLALAGVAFYFLRGTAPEPTPVAEPKPPEQPPVEPIAKAPEPPPPPEEVKEPEPSAPPEAKEPAPEEAKAPEPPPPPPPPSPMDKLKQRIEAAGTDCTALKGLAREPLLQKSDPQSLELRNQVVGKLGKNCREALIAEAKNLCPGQRPPDVAPELVIVFDASGSMRISLLATQQDLQQAEIAERMLGPFAAFAGQNFDQLLREPTRITTAKKATLAIAKKIPRDANVGLVLIEQCPAARSVGFFPPGQHGALLSQLQAIEPKAGTPLADGIAKAGQMVDGVKREAVILVVSDGQESCRREDPCAVAASLARAKPHLKINVVDITGTGAGNCLARATNGKVFPANKPEEVALGTDKAAADVMTPAHCARK